MKTSGFCCETKFGLLVFLGHPSLHVYFCNQVFDNSTDTCTTNYSTSSQPVPCSEAYASSQGLLHFVFQQVGRKRWLLWCNYLAGGGLPEYCQCQFQLEYWSERQGNQSENRKTRLGITVQIGVGLGNVSSVVVAAIFCAPVRYAGSTWPTVFANLNWSKFITILTRALLISMCHALHTMVQLWWWPPHIAKTI